MKKLFALSFLLCFVFSSFASVTLPEIKVEKYKTEKVVLETVAVSNVSVILDNSILLPDIVVQRQCSDSIDKISYTYATIKNNSFNSDRYWYRNCVESYRYPKDFKA